MGLAGDFVIASDYGDLADRSSLKPIGRIIQSTVQALTDATFVPITFTAPVDSIDTHNYHDPSVNPSRVTLQMPGYYRFTGTLWMATATTPVRTSLQFRKNGVAIAPTMEDAFNGRQHSTPTVTLITNINAGDYVELWGFQDSAATINTFVSGAASSVVEWEYMRDL